MSSNRRVRRILECATRCGWVVEHKTLTYSKNPDVECWTLRPDPNPDDATLTVYGGQNHSATVMADLPGDRDWSLVSQRYAMGYMGSHRSGVTS